MLCWLQNRKNTSERLELKKYNRFLRRMTVSAAAASPGPGLQVHTECCEGVCVLFIDCCGFSRQAHTDSPKMQVHKEIK